MSLVAVFLFALGLTILVPIVPLYVTDELGEAEQWIGTATLAVSFAAVATRIPGGSLSDRRGRRNVMLLGAIMGVVASVLYLASQHVIVFLLARLGTGASIGLYTTANKALAADLAPPTRRGEALGMNNAAFSLASVISPLLSEGLKNAISFQAVFAASGALTLGALAMTWVLPPSRPERTTQPNARFDVQDTLRERGTWAAILLMLSSGAILALMFTFYPLLAERKDLFHDAPGFLSSVAMGAGLSIWALADVFIEPIAGRVSDRVGRQIVAIPGLIVAVIGVWILSRAHNTMGAYLAISVVAMGWGILRSSADAISQDALAPVLRGMGAAIIYTSFDLAIGIDAQILSGLIDGTDFGAFFQAIIAMVAVFGILGIMLSTRLVTFEDREIAPGEAPATGD